MHAGNIFSLHNTLHDFKWQVRSDNNSFEESGFSIAEEA